MPLYQVIVLGIVQGLTEFLPISSTAHLYVFPWLFGWVDPGLSFDIALHVGTLLALFIYFFGDWIQIIRAGLGLGTSGRNVELRRSPGLLWLLVVGTIPAGVAGMLFKKQAEGSLRNAYVIGAMTILIGLVMLWAELLSRRNRRIGSVSMVDAVIIGAAQAIAILPGTSRSGITISAGMLRDFDRRAAARFSFLLSVPAIAGAAAKDFWDLIKHEGGIPAEMKIPFLVGILVSAAVGCVCIKFFMDFVRKHTLIVFVWYRAIFGIIVIALAFFRSRG